MAPRPRCAASLLPLLFLLGLLDHAAAEEEKQEHAGQFVDAASSGEPAEAARSAPIPVTIQAREPTLELNRFLFKGNILQARSDHAEHWLVFFCPAWYDPCQKLMPTYSQESVVWQGRLNSDLFRLAVRFATVDCASEKVLCNEQGVQEYPTVVHYHEGQATARWTPGGRRDLAKVMERLQKWITKRMEPDPASQPKATSQPGVDGEASLSMSTLLRFLPNLAKSAPADYKEMAIVFSLLPLSFWAFAARSQRRHQAIADAKQAKLHRELSETEGGPLDDAGMRWRRCLPQAWASARPSLEL